MGMGLKPTPAVSLLFPVVIATTKVPTVQVEKVVTGGVPHLIMTTHGTVSCLKEMLQLTNSTAGPRAVFLFVA